MASKPSHDLTLDPNRRNHDKRDTQAAVRALLDAAVADDHDGVAANEEREPQPPPPAAA